MSSYEQIAVQMFRHFDKDLSGTLTKNEIRDLLAAIHQTPSQDVLDQMFSQVDKDGDGSIDLQVCFDLIEHSDNAF